MRVDEQQVLGFSRELWSAKLGLQVANETAEAAPYVGAPMLASGIRVSGPWTGAILLECDASIVQHAAVVLFDGASDEPSAEDLADAVNELAVMLGRKILPLLPESSSLSRPSVVNDAGSFLHGRRSLNSLNLTCEGRPLRVSLLEDAEVPVPAA